MSIKFIKDFLLQIRKNLYGEASTYSFSFIPKEDIKLYSSENAQKILKTDDKDKVDNEEE